VLGGAIDGSGRGNEVALNEGAERLTVVPELARRYPNARILFSGGSGALIDDSDAEAKFALRLLESLGVARGRIQAPAARQPHGLGHGRDRRVAKMRGEVCESETQLASVRRSY
jgi:hypothetical protein